MLEDVLRAAVPEVASAAVAMIAVGGRTAAACAVGEAVRYADASERVLADRPPVTLGSVFDIASITKPFTTLVLLSLAADGRVGLDEPVATWLPRHYGGRPEITLRHLLTHTSGLPAGRRVEKEPARLRWELVLSTPAERPPGAHLYSDVGMITAGRVAEIAGAAPLDVLVRERITGPLGLTDTLYHPGPSLLPRIVATECKTGRGSGCVRGQVHDETAYALGGVTGHAGLFSTADDLLRFGEALRTGGAGAVPPAAIVEMIRDQGVGPDTDADTDAPGHRQGLGYRQGLGVRIGDPAIVGPLTGAFGHSGFTGTSLVVDPVRRLTVVLLTNNVHPVRGRPGIRELRTAVAAEALRLT
ncbi:serine hydrolase domain-containing protein [Sphaerimonospora thailandensis]|uniref:Beta-lactamase-related domain-containing protein n=1 Tax=Sphaerimonospora thailandensis TaxID=795644 RepID=A0A8J3VXH2_9ACTN|nr:serine hydrolase domain-containing protein [Sphaerimonospora thailandensis]GIH68492.1 hypothetical protein Mth01_07450 [Sphaerimonospora thailandensis]